MPLLADRWRLLAPGCGCSGTPSTFAYDFTGYAEFLHQFLLRLDLRCRRRQNRRAWRVQVDVVECPGLAQVAAWSGSLVLSLLW